MAYGDGYKKQPERYEERACPKCQKVRPVRKDQPLDKLCKSCSRRGLKLNFERKCPFKDPQKDGSYRSYWQAKRRCKESPYYTEVEFRFDDFDEWFTELGPRPEGCSVDRIDNLGHYEPGNVRWATHKEQCNNRRRRGTAL
jgi:hypothetical protein